MGGAGRLVVIDIWTVFREFFEKLSLMNNRCYKGFQSSHIIVQTLQSTSSFKQNSIILLKKGACSY